MALSALILGSAGSACARGTPAGTEVVAQASVSYARGGEQHQDFSNESVMTVDEVVDFEVVWQDAGRVEAAPGPDGMVLTFLLENTGNGREGFRLLALSALADGLGPQNLRLFFDGDGDGQYDPDRDEIYRPGLNEPDLIGDEGRLVFLVADMPEGLLDGAEGLVKLVVTSMTGVAPPGTIVIGAGDGGTSAVIGSAGGMVERPGIFQVVTVELGLAKSAIVSDPDGGAEPRSGAVITYTITATALGGGIARDVVVTDPLPRSTVYVPNSLRLNGLPLTDGADADAGDFGGTTPETVTVRLGDVSGGSPGREIAFQVVIP